MKVCIVGTGGVGGYFGARLAADGNQVVFVARGAHGAALAERGLRLRSKLGDLHIERPDVRQDPGEAGPCDLVLICVKLWDTEAAAALVAPILAPESAVISLQNGISAEATLTERLGPGYVVGGASHVSAHIAEPGVIEHLGTLARLVMGELDGTASPRLERLLAACQSAGIEARAPEHIRTEIWRKFVHLAPFAGAACFYRVPLAALREDGDKQQMLAALVAEGLAVARAEGLDFAPGYEDKVVASYGKLPAQMKPSMLIDLEAGRRLELPWLNGEVARRGRALGVATPASDQVVAALAELAGGRA